jgi:hypothetical protein
MKPFIPTLMLLGFAGKSISKPWGEPKGTNLIKVSTHTLLKERPRILDQQEFAFNPLLVSGSDKTMR